MNSATSAIIGSMTRSSRPCRRPEQRPDLRAEQRRPVERHADRAPADGRVLFLGSRGNRAAPCRRRHRACGRSPAARRAPHRGSPGRAASAASSRGKVEAIMNCSSVRNSPMPSAPDSSQMRQVDEETGIHQRSTPLAVAGHRRLVAQAPRIAPGAAPGSAPCRHRPHSTSGVGRRCTSPHRRRR